MGREEICIALEVNCVPDIEQTIEDARASSFDFVVVPLVHPRYKRDQLNIIPKRDEPITRSDMLLTSQQWNTWILGKTSPWINLDSENELVRRNSESDSELSAAKTPSGRRLHDPWEWWNTLRSLCDNHQALGVALEFTADLPSEAVLDKWIGEPIKVVILPTTVFLTNKHGYPVLSKRHQDFLKRLFDFKPIQYVVKGRAHHAEGYLPYQQYIAFLHSKLPPPTEQVRFESPYYDYLQAPLQPLQDNLESQTYETFEKDPVKYERYEEAVYRALLDRTAEGSTTVLMVVGAGRGPLVRASLRAAQRAKRALRVYAVEKNPNAVVTLRNMRESLGWGDTVTVVDQDMRYWNASEPADILVSELLGSFGDNELSPECLDGAQKFLRPNGISIPYNSTAFVAPITSPKLWQDVKAYDDLTHFETAYVVKMHNVAQLAPAKPAWTFVHPSDASGDNRRYAKMSWTFPTAATVHGFAGYFESGLYKDVMISIHPPTFSTGMFSWFPIYFPLKTPVYVPEGGTLECHFWRCTAAHKVWYEWSVTAPEVVPIHNPNGRSYWIGL